MKYFAVSYHVTKDRPVGEGGFAILLCASINEGVIHPTVEDSGDLPIRNMLIQEGLVDREDYMVSLGKGTYQDDGESLEEVAKTIYGAYQGRDIVNNGNYVSLELEPDQCRKFHRDRWSF